MSDIESEAEERYDDGSKETRIKLITVSLQKGFCFLFFYQGLWEIKAEIQSLLLAARNPGI
jgi:hypothetical protein